MPTGPTALESFLAGIEGRAFRFAWFAVGHREEALEIVQETMLKLVQRYRGRAPEEWPALFHTILQSRIRDWRRRERVRSALRHFFARGEEESGGDPLEQIPADASGEPPRQAAGEELRAAIERAVRELPPRQQQAFLLRAWEGLDTAATARVMGCSEGSVKTHYSRAQQALREKLRDCHE